MGHFPGSSIRRISWIEWGNRSDHIFDKTLESFHLHYCLFGGAGIERFIKNNISFDDVARQR